MANQLRNKIALVPICVLALAACSSTDLIAVSANAANEQDAGSRVLLPRDGSTPAAAPTDTVDASVSDAGVRSTEDAGTAALDGSIRDAPRGTGPGDWGPGDYPPDLTAQTYLELTGIPGQNGYARGYKVHVPKSYNPNVPMPAVFCFHGLAQNSVMFCVDGSGWVPKSDLEGFLLVMPNGYQSSWNGGSCCGAASNERLDDVAFVRALFAELGTHLNIDQDRVFATGLSNGGYMSYRLACDAADLFAAVAPGAGAVGTPDIGGGTNIAPDFTDCSPSHPISVLAMHGTADGLVPFNLFAPSLTLMAEANQCTFPAIPATLPSSGGDTDCVTYPNCAQGAQVTGCTVQNGGHVWFGDESCGTGAGAGGCGFVGTNSDTLVNTNAAWDFFSAVPVR